MNIDQMIAEGLLLIHLDPEHDLKVCFRCNLFSAFDETLGEGARRFRVKLAKMTVAKVLSRWDSLLSEDNTPRRALVIAEHLLEGAIALESAKDEIGSLWTHCDDLAWKYEDEQSVIMVGYGAVQAAREAMSEKHFGCNGITDGGTDIDVDPYDHDTAFCAAIAYSGGPSWDKASDSEKRLEFWTWWLTSAVRTAMAEI